MVGKTNLFNIKCRHLVDVFHTYEINTLKSFQMSHYRVHCVSGIFCLIFRTESGRFEVLFDWTWDTVFQKYFCPRALHVTEPHYLVAHCLEIYKQHGHKRHEHDGYRLNCLNPSACVRVIIQVYFSSRGAKSRRHPLSHWIRFRFVRRAE